MARYITRDLKLYNKILKGSPVILDKSRLLYDNETLDLILQVSLKNFSDKDIKSVCFIAKFYDNENKLLKENEKVVIKEKINKAEEFSTNDPIIIKDDNVFHVSLIIYSVEFVDGSTWVNKGKKEGTDILEKVYIENTDFINAVKWKELPVVLNNYPVFTDDYYICSCGKMYMQGVTKCTGCGVEKEELIKVFSNKNIQKLISEYKKSPERAEDEVEKEFDLPQDYSSEDGMNFLGIVLLVGGIIVVAYVIYSLIEKSLF